MIAGIKRTVFSLKIKENIKEHLSLNELEYLGTTVDEEILEKVNAYVGDKTEDFDVSEVIDRFYRALPDFESYKECLEYFIEKDPFLNGMYKQDKVDDFIEALHNDRLFANLVKREDNDDIESELIGKDVDL